MRTLLAIPVYNEERHVTHVLERVQDYTGRILVIDDGSTDSTPSLLAKQPVEVIRHSRNRGYGRSMQDAFRWAAVDGYDWVVTMDCDEQHEPAAIPQFIRAAEADTHDVISGSRYMPERVCGYCDSDNPPPDRRAINAELTAEINARLAPVLGGEITDAFCGFKAYRVAALARLRLTVDGYAFPMQFWVQAAAARLRVREVPVRLIYNDLNRTFGGPLNDPAVRLKHYRQVLHCELERCADRLPAPALANVEAGCR